MGDLAAAASTQMMLSAESIAEGQGMGMASHVEEFACCVAEYQYALERLRQVENRMTMAVNAMASERAPRERLLAAERF